MAGLLSILGLDGGTAVKNTLEGVGTLAKDIRQAITGEISAEKKAELAQKAVEIESAALNFQAQINLEEARSPHLFVSGWRPALGWVCNIALALYYIPQFLLASILWVKVSWAAQQIAAYPISQIDGLLELVFLMLGVGGLRTIEKIKGVAAK